MATMLHTEPVEQLKCLASLEVAWVLKHRHETKTTGSLLPKNELLPKNTASSLTSETTSVTVQACLPCGSVKKAAGLLKVIPMALSKKRQKEKELAYLSKKKVAKASLAQPLDVRRSARSIFGSQGGKVLLL